MGSVHGVSQANGGWGFTPYRKALHWHLALVFFLPARIIFLFFLEVSHGGGV